MNEKKLLELKQEIDEAKVSKTKLEARKDLLMEQLKDKWGVSSLKAASKKLDSLAKDLKEWDEKIETATDELVAQLEEQDE